MIDTVALIKRFCEYDFAQRNCEKAISLLSEDIRWFGTSDNEDAHSKEEARRYLQSEIKAAPEPYEMQLLEEAFLPAGEDSGIAFLRMRFSHSDVVLNIRITAVSRMEGGAEKLCSMHFSVADSSQQAGEYFPVEQHKRKLEQEKMSLVLSTMEGGLMGCYMEKDFPFYFINDRMLQYLGYDSEQEFVADIGGLVGNMIHPDDLKSVELSSREQVFKDGCYAEDYRMRKRDGSYIWVHDIGKLSTDQNGRAVTVSVCYDVTKEHREKQRLDDIINAIPGGVAIYKISDIFETVFFSDGVPELSGYTVEEYNELIKCDAALLTHPDDRELVVKKAREAVARHACDGWADRRQSPACSAARRR